MNECPNVIIQTKFDKNKCLNIFVKEKFIRRNVPIYSDIRIYLSRSGPVHEYCPVHEGHSQARSPVVFNLAALPPSGKSI